MLVPLMNATFMLRLTRRSPAETTRNPALRLALLAALSTLALGVAGCSTPGPLHVYTAGPSRPAVVHDTSREAPVEVPSFLQPGETLTGFAYDPFTDHLFLRLAPGNRFRVVDRPARAIKREFTAAATPATGGGDLAIRSLDRHLFLAHPTEPAVIELTLYGKLVRTIPLAPLHAPPAGVAYDQVRERLYILMGGDLAYITMFDRTGRKLGAFPLDRTVALGALAYDSVAREFYVPLLGRPALGVFDEQGRLLREQAAPGPEPAAFLDVGPRSFLRLF